MAVNLMGFKKVSKIPAPKGRSIYDPLLTEVLKTGGIYVLNVEDTKRAYSLAATIKQVIKKNERYGCLYVGVVNHTTVFVEKRG